MATNSTVNFMKQASELADELAGDLVEFASVYSEGKSTPAELCDSFSRIDGKVKKLIALTRLGSSSAEVRGEEGAIVSLLGNCESAAVTSPGWQAAFQAMQQEVKKLQLQTKLPQVPNPNPTEEFSDGIYVTGPDRVTEGEPEMDFDIPEATAAEEVENEIAMLVEELRASS